MGVVHNPNMIDNPSSSDLLDKDSGASCICNDLQESGRKLVG